MNDRNLGVWLVGAHASDFATSNDGRNRRWGDSIALLIDYEATVGIAVEGETDVGSVSHNSLLQVY